MLNRILSILLLLFLLVPTHTATAQDAPPSGPVYVVQGGDTFYSIAIQFGVTIDAIVQANPQVDPNFLIIGTEIVIPGLEGVRGRLMTKTVPLGETLRSLSIRNQVAQEQLMKLNRITSPSEVYAGASLIVPEVENAQPPQSKFLLRNNESLFQLAVVNGINPWLLAETNLMTSTWDAIPGEALFDQGGEGEARVNPISPVVKSLAVNPLPIQQGETATIWLETTEPVELTGNLAGYDLMFFPVGENRYVALQGVHAMDLAGIYPLTIGGKLPNGTEFSFEQMVILEALGYIQENIQGVDPNTIDPEVTRPEEDLVHELITKVTPQKYWDGAFIVPGYDPSWITSTYGNRRSYNGGPYSYFHTGVDYGGGTGLPIKSPAPGVVVFAGPLTVRGNATIIDHGWGVFSGFWHQSEINVKVGDRVETGQEIGKVGGTGRITGPHLHWEIWVNGVQVDPLTWLETPFPQE